MHFDCVYFAILGDEILFKLRMEKIREPKFESKMIDGILLSVFREFSFYSEFDWFLYINWFIAKVFDLCMSSVTNCDDKNEAMTSDWCCPIVQTGINVMEQLRYKILYQSVDNSQVGKRKEIDKVWSLDYI